MLLVLLLLFIIAPFFYFLPHLSIILTVKLFAFLTLCILWFLIEFYISANFPFYQNIHDIILYFYF